MAFASAATSDTTVVVSIIRYASGLLFETRPLRKIFILDDFVCGFFSLSLFVLSPVLWHTVCMHLCLTVGTLKMRLLCECVAMTRYFRIYTYIYTM